MTDLLHRIRRGHWPVWGWFGYERLPLRSLAYYALWAYLTSPVRSGCVPPGPAR